MCTNHGRFFCVLCLPACYSSEYLAIRRVGDILVTGELFAELFDFIPAVAVGLVELEGVTPDV